MIRQHIIPRHLRGERYFRWRGGDVSRIKGLSDGVFAFALTLLVVLAAGCGGGGESPPNLLLITLDTTRADVLGCYGGDVDTPVLDRLAAEGVRFDDAWTVTPLTLPSHASILTGLYPPSHGIRENTHFRLSPEVRTLAGHLQDHGYRTGAAVSSFVLSRIFGLDSGFEVYHEPRPAGPIRPGGAGVEFREILERTAGETTDQVLDGLLPAGDSPWFLWVHYYDPHAAYEPPEPYASRYADDLYRGEVAYMDAEIGRLLDGLRARGMLDNTLTAVVSDHGESLGDHGENTHGLFIYRPTARVPLILHLPGTLEAGTVRNDPVSVVDLAPTVLELMGMPAMTLPGEHAAGRSVVHSSGERWIYAESELPMRAYGWAPLYSLHDGQERFIETVRPELYDMVSDPGESDNRTGEDPEAVAGWRRRLVVLAERLPPAPAADGPEPDDEDRRRLMSLGYLSGGSAPQDEADRADPKDQVALHNALIRAGALLAAGDPGSAAEAARSVLQQDPDNPGALALAGVLGASAGKSGIEDLRRAADLSPGNWEIRRNLANALHNAGDLDGAAREYRAVLAIQPDLPAVRFGLGNVLSASGDLAQAEANYRVSLELDGDQPAVLAALGTTLGRGGKLDEARARLQSALALDPSLADAWNQLGIVEEKRSDLPAARDAYLRCLEQAPDHADGLFNASKVFIRLGDRERALQYLKALREVAPDYPLIPALEQRL